MVRCFSLRFFALATIFASVLAGAGAQSAPSAQDAEIYFTPFSHLDLFWGGTREECLARGNGIIAKAVQLAKQHPKFRFLLEDNVFVANYVDTHPGSQEVEDLKRFIKEGRIEIAPKWAAIFQGLPDGEVHARNMMIGKRYAQEVFGVDARVAHLGDLPDYTPQFPQILSQSRVPFMVMTRMGPTDKSLFQWKGLDGSKALVWSTLKGYGWGTFLSSKTQLDEQKRERFRKDVAEVRATTNGPILMNWGTDLWAPPSDLVARVEAFNKFAPANLMISTPNDFFRRVEKAAGIPETSGEIPSSWPNVVSSLPHIWPEIIPATNTLLAAEKFASINYALGYAGYPQREFDLMWKKLVESMDHNHDGQGGLEIGDGRKVEYLRLATIGGGEILRDSLRNIAERVQIPVKNSFPIVVFNPLNWTRDDVVKAHLSLYGEVAPADIAEFRKGLRLLDEAGNAIPIHVEEYSENISRALNIVFTAKGVPSIGYKTYYLVAGQPDAFPNTARIELDQERDRKDPRRSLGSDVVENDFYRLSVDRATGRVALFDKALNRDVARDMEVVALEERGGNYIGIEPLSGRTIVGTAEEVSIEENNPVRTVVRVLVRVADIPIVQRLTLYKGLKRLDIENTVEWKTPRFIRLQQLFPLTQSNASLHYGIPFGSNAAENIMPKSGPRAGDEIKQDSWQRSRHIHGWIHAGGPEWGLTLASDHHQIRLGDDLIRAEMLRGTRYTSVKVVRGDEITSMHYPPPGKYVFRYSLSAERGDWKAAKAYRGGMGLTNPLAPVSVVDTMSAKSLPATNSFCSLPQENVIVSALKKADRDSSLLLRLYDIEGAPVETSVQFLGASPTFSETNLLEEDLPAQQRQVIQAGPYAIRTLKIRADKMRK